MTIRREAVRSALDARPKWLEENIEWALKKVEDGKGMREDVICFTADLLGSRFTTIWQNQKSAVTRKQRDCGGRESKRARHDLEKCDQCQGQKEWCCLECVLAKMNTVCASHSTLPDRRHPLRHRGFRLHFISQTRWTRILMTHHKRRITA